MDHSTQKIVKRIKSVNKTYLWSNNITKQTTLCVHEYAVIQMIKLPYDYRQRDNKKTWK